MPRTSAGSSRIELRIRPEDKITLMRAAALKNMNLTGFILEQTLPLAKAAVEKSERIVLSERDSLMVLDLLENPPKPTAKLKRAAKAGQILR